MALQRLDFPDLWRLTKTEYLTMNPSIISKCQIQNFKEPFCHFEIALKKLSNSFRILTSCFLPFEVVSHTNQLGGKWPVG